MTATVDKSLERLRERAAAEGLLDVAYATADSPFGTLLLARTPQGLVRLALPSEDVEATLADLASRISPRLLEAPAQLDEERRELEDYFEGRRQEFDLPIDWQLSNGFLLRARRGIAAIPYGETRTYTDLARQAGTKVMLDFQSSWYERDLRAVVRDNIDLIHMVQLSDFVIGTSQTGDRAVPGDGDIPLEYLVEMVLEAGFEGAFDLELMGPRIEDEGYGSVIRRAVDRSSELLDRIERQSSFTEEEYLHEHISGLFAWKRCRWRNRLALYLPDEI